MKNIQVITWNQPDGLDYLYRIDKPEDGKRFFKDLLNNAEMDGRESFAISEISQSEWKRAEQNGRDMA